MLSSDSSAEEIRDSGRSFQSLIVWGEKLYWLRVSEFGEWVRFLNFSALNHFYLTAVTGLGTSPALATCETSHVLLVGVSGGFPGVLPFRWAFVILALRPQYHTGINNPSTEWLVSI